MLEQPFSGPHAHASYSVSRTMQWVMLALVPATLYGMFTFGWPAINLFFVTVVSAALAEAVCLRLAGKPVRFYLTDGSAVLTGWLLAMTLPPWAPWWIGVIGGLLAIVIGKQVFGGLGQNLFNPAMVARVALLIAFPLEMTTFIDPQPLFATASPDFFAGLNITLGNVSSEFDAISGASILGHVRNSLDGGTALGTILTAQYEPATLALGAIRGSLGETSSVLILLGGLLLLYKRIITWHIPVSVLATLFLLATVMNLVDDQIYPGGIYHLITGATLLGAFFIATDLVTSPVTPRGQLIYGVGIGILVYVIRTWAGYPEGMAFAVMLMNGCTPLIDHYVKPRIYGRDSKGQPLAWPEHEVEKIS